MSSSHLDLLFQQILEGWDIPTPQGLLRIKQEDAAKQLPAHPYSALKNLAHAVFWQDLWLGQLAGQPRPPSEFVWQNDFRDPDPSEWPTLRRRFVEGLQEARRYCQADPPALGCDSEEKAVDLLLRIAIHASYHMGQLNLLKRALRASNSGTSGDDEAE
ncbi:MAG: hypothetical protein KJZ62_01085 [Fimbriimonadaceae bacterium]|nr:hypothetical protein [Fimbriimonadaceae bacterium]MCL4283674.1 hypothetical protein [Fimbriimonadaceae bacterium]QOJ11414.1 MAG: hypothetical protein HRU74_04880 [Chthonomonadaceae bacterium]